MPRPDDPDALREELLAVPKADRLAWLADQPDDRLRAFRRLLGPEESKRLSAFMDARRRDAARRAQLTGPATGPWAMVDELREPANWARLKPSQKEWIEKIASTAERGGRRGGGFSPKQQQVIEDIHAAATGRATDDGVS